MAVSKSMKKKFRKTTRAAAPPTKEFTAPTSKLGDYVYEHGTSKAAARNIEVTEALSNYVGMMMSTMACFRATLMILLAEPDLKEPRVPERCEEAKDAQGVVVKNEDGTTKQVDKNPALFRMEITLYTDVVKLIRKKREEWLNISAKIFHLALQHSPPKLRELYHTMSAWQGVYDNANGIELLCMVQQISHNQVEQKQVTYSYVELILETLTIHQEQGETNND